MSENLAGDVEGGDRQEEAGGGRRLGRWRHRLTYVTAVSSIHDSTSEQLHYVFESGFRLRSVERECSLVLHVVTVPNRNQTRTFPGINCLQTPGIMEEETRTRPQVSQA